MKYLLLLLSVLISSVCFGQIPAPTGLQAAWDDDLSVIKLHWDSLHEEIAGYHLYVKTPEQSKFFLWTAAGLIFGTTTTFSSIDSYGGVYAFKVAGFNNFPARNFGEPSLPVELTVPSLYLPLVTNIVVKNTKHHVEISWEYPSEIYDLAGFLLVINGEEAIVGNSARSFELNNLDPGNYHLTISAYNTSGRRSNLSNKKSFVIK